MTVIKRALAWGESALFMVAFAMQFIMGALFLAVLLYFFVTD